MGCLPACGRQGSNGSGAVCGGLSVMSDHFHDHDQDDRPGTAGGRARRSACGAGPEGAEDAFEEGEGAGVEPRVAADGGVDGGVVESGVGGDAADAAVLGGGFGDAGGEGLGGAGGVGVGAVASDGAVGEVGVGVVEVGAGGASRGAGHGRTVPTADDAGALDVSSARRNSVGCNPRYRRELFAGSGHDDRLNGTLGWEDPHLVATTIENYRGPDDYPHDVWQLVRPAVLRRTKAAQPHHQKSAYDLLGVNAQFACWLHTAGYDHADDALAFEPVLVERFLATEHGDDRRATLAKYRGVLKKTAAALPAAPYTPRPKPIGRDGHQPPYTPAEQARLWSWAASQPSARRPLMEAVVVFSLGAGMEAHDFRHTRADDVRSHADGTVTVEVRGNRARTTVVLAEWEAEARRLAAAAGAAGTWLWNPAYEDRTNKNAFTSSIGRCAPPAPGFRLSVRRARTTWVVSLIDRGVPFPAIIRAAGLRPNSMSNFMPHIAVPDSLSPSDMALLRHPEARRP